MTILTDSGSPSAYSNTPNCLVCGEALDLRQTQGRNSRKPSLMFVCPVDGRHFRAFVTFRPYVEAVLARLEGHASVGRTDIDPADAVDSHSRRSKAGLERDKQA